MYRYIGLYQRLVLISLEFNILIGFKRVTVQMSSVSGGKRKSKEKRQMTAGALRNTNTNKQTNTDVCIYVLIYANKLFI